MNDQKEEVVTIQVKAKNANKIVNKIHCPFTRFGCQENLDLNNLNKHTAVCKFKPKQCKICHRFISISEEELAKHITECSKEKEKEEMTRSLLIISKINDARNSQVTMSSFDKDTTVYSNNIHENKKDDITTNDSFISDIETDNEKKQNVKIEGIKEYLYNCENKCCNYHSDSLTAYEVHKVCCKFGMEKCIYALYGCNKEYPRGMMKLHEDNCSYKPAKLE